MIKDCSQYDVWFVGQINDNSGYLRTLADITFQQCISDHQNENLCCTLKVWSLRIGEGYLGKICLYILVTAEILVKDQAPII